MYYLTIEDHFSSAHQLREYKGKCENLHGHNWRVLLTVRGDTLDKAGMLIDFNDLKAILKKITDYLDHKNLNQLPPFDELNPSSENLARYISEECQKHMDTYTLAVHAVEVYESDTSRCRYEP